jgi:exodeoxyribonuclease VII large subunit
VNAPTLSVRALTETVRDVLHATFPAEVWVEGEITSLSRPSNGHVYFTIVEPGEAGAPPVASLPVVLFDGDRRRVNATLKATTAVRMTDGVWVRIRGRVTLWPPSGRLQLRMTAIDPEHTVGKLALEREALLATLRDEALLDVNAARLLPVLPERIGLVTSAGTAAYADVLGELAAAAAGAKVLVADVTVQGPGAAADIARAVDVLAQAGAELVMVVRGGGARTDLVPFDDERVARAIAAATVPVLTGIGHDIDTTVADAVAHRAFKTPTACAAFVAGRADQEALRLAGAVDALATSVPHRLAARGRELDRTLATVGRLASSRVIGAQRRVDALSGHVRALDPARVLARGWSITRRSDGSVLRSAGAVAQGEELVTTLADGTVRSTVGTGTEGGDEGHGA